MNTYEQFFTAVLKRLKIEPNIHTLYALCSVAKLEGLNDRFNPLNSVVPSGNSSKWNDVGVQDYKTYANGVAGTVKLLKGDPWINVVTAMRKQQSSKKILAEFSTVYATWNSHPNWPVAHELLNEPLGGGEANPPNKPIPAKPPTRVPIPKGAKTYKVQEGDTLYGIAEKEYNKPGRWPEIAKANNIIKPYRIYPKEILLIP